jgi:archaellum component FlaC
MESQNFWRRMGEWFRSPGRSESDFDSGDGGVAVADASSVEHALVASTPTQPVAADRTLERLETEYHRVVGLIESISIHLEGQEQRAVSMTESIDALTAALSSLPEDARAEAEALDGIREQLKEDAVRAKRLEDQFAGLPKLADMQRETMASIDRRLSDDVDRNERIHDSLGEVRQALVAVGESATASTNVLREVHAQTLDREERMGSLLEAQSRRLTWIAAIAITVAAAAVVVSAIALFR